jgi:hypothetical protein
MVQVSRRAVLGAGAVALVGGLVAGLGPLPANAATAAVATASTLPPLDRSSYSSWVGAPFTAEHAGTTHSITLARIHDVDGASNAQAQSCFALVFTARTRLPEGIYAISRRGVPTRQLFLGHLGAGTAMQVLVNRSR